MTQVAYKKTSVIKWLFEIDLASFKYFKIFQLCFAISHFSKTFESNVAISHSSKTLESNVHKIPKFQILQ